ncbi:MAG: NADP-dependent oxidoreductase [bacterium]|nr:NADP-dependent oxidoreductase [bacterium]
MNKQILLASRPKGFPSESDFRLVESPVPEPKEGELLLRVIYLSVDPYMRGRMRDSKSYAEPVGIGDVMVGGTVAEVVESRHPGFRQGEIVEAYLGWQEYGISDGKGLRKVDPALAPVSTALGVLGMPGLTAYFGLLDLGRPKAGETVLVSGAAGAVGSVAGQIAKIPGCRVVGIAGSDEKVRYVVEEIGFDAAFNYKNHKDYPGKLAELCPEGIDVYFDNVGGRITDAAIVNLKLKARVAICGQISQYNLAKPELGPRLLFHLIVKRARMEGFLVLDYADRFAEGARQMAEWLKQGKLRYREQVVDGIENAPAAFLDMMRGGNIGKQLVRVSAGLQ